MAPRHEQADVTLPGSPAADAKVATLARSACDAADSLAQAPEQSINAALTGMAGNLRAAAADVLAANHRDLATAQASGLSAAMCDRLRLDDDRLDVLARQLRLLAEAPAPPRDTELRRLDGGLRLVERRRPVGVIGANFEARPNVTVDVASQLVKSRNGGVLRTGAAALGSSQALHRLVIRPALAGAGLDDRAIQLIDEGDREFARALVRQPGLIPLVIIRGSGETTRSLALEGARHGVRTMAHADGGGVLYVDAAADHALATRLLITGLDRLAVCNRVNLVLVAEPIYGTIVPAFVRALAEIGVTASLPPHSRPLGYEWALDAGHEANVTVSPVADVSHAATVANQETSGLVATVVTEDAAAARQFIDRYQGTGVFWNSSSRLLDGFKLHQIPETGINLDRVPGPRGPVTFRDLYLRQYVVLPPDAR